MFRAVAKTLKTTVLALGAMVLISGQAQALQYVGKWDPAFGSPFPQLGWKGSAIFEIPDACLAHDGTYFNNFGCAANNGLKMISAQVDFYNLATPSSILDTLYFSMPSATLTMKVTDNELSGVVGAFLDPDHSNLSIAGNNTDFWLGFTKSGGNYFARLYFQQWGPCPDDDDECHKQQLELCIVDSGFSQISADPSGRPLMSFTRVALEVPEPGSIALLVPALGMLAVFRRRRTAA